MTTREQLEYETMVARRDEAVSMGRVAALQLKRITAENSHLKRLHYLEEHEQRERMRPSRCHFAHVEFDDVRNEWRASTNVPGDDEGVVAYGHTPEAACNNYDTLWVQGTY
jgi:hypothetical protein